MIEDGIGDLIGYLVGMAFADGFGGKEVGHDNSRIEYYNIKRWAKLQSGSVFTSLGRKTKLRQGLFLIPLFLIPD